MTYKEVLDYWIENKPIRSGKTLWLMIAKAIEKQIPKKPIIRRYYQGAHAMLPDLDAAECPNCGTWNVGMNEYDVRFDFCIYCGQAIDWSEEVETNGRTN